ATFGGVGVGLLSGLAVEEATWFAMPFAVIVAVVIVSLGRHTKIAGDAALGVFFAVSLAIGISALHFAARRGAGIDIEAVLFGNILGVQPHEVLIMKGLFLLVMITLWFQGPRIAYSGFYPELAAMSGIRVQRQEYLLMALTAVVTVLAVKSVGVMLVSAWLVIPATIGRHLSRRFGTMLLLAFLAAILGSFVGLVASYYCDLPGGAAMTLALGLLFVGSLVVRGLQNFRFS
ncbi:MAG: metal ABC transporter permease, partial [Proteobacteria bacterium]|nr:metal ABC transporter permease [Pseudomonadota bacterium]